MIEQTLFFALGFLSASVLTIFIANAIWRRAVRLTTKRVQAALPVSLAEIKADRDQLRTEFAMAARKLEMSVEQLKTRGHLQLVDITRKNEQLRVVLDEVKKRTETINEMEKRETQIRAECLAAETAFAATNKAMKAAEERLVVVQAKLAEREREVSETSSLAHSRQVEIAALQANLAHLETIVEDTKSALNDSSSALGAKQTAFEAVRAELAAALSHRDDIEAKIIAAWSEVREQTALLGTTQLHLSEDSDGLQALVGQAKALAQRVHQLMSERDLLDQDMTRRIAEAEMRHDLLSKEFDTFRAERKDLEIKLGTVQAERDELVARLRLLENGAEANWESERLENAMLRERMNDLAAEITAISMTLEGDASPIRKIIATAEADLKAGTASRAPNASHQPAEAGQVSLAERVRALQARALPGQ